MKMPELRITFAAVLLFAPLAGAAQTLPATAPTGTAQPAPIAATPTPVMHGRHAYVSFADGQLNVKANNSSLNVILRQISKETGMKITGGVPEERVFGEYGPADPGTVIATLLGGIGVNVEVLADENNRPKELVLTARTGGATPPSPTSSSFDEEARAEELILPPPGQVAVDVARPGTVGFNNSHTAPNGNTTPVPTPVTSNGTTAVPNPNYGSPVTTPPQAGQPFNNVNGSSLNTTPTASQLPTTNSVPLDAIGTPSTTPSTSGIVDSPNPAPAGTTANPATTSTTTTSTAPDGTTTTTVVNSPNPTVNNNGTTTTGGTTTQQSPNGTATPEDIYKRLLDLQKAKQAQSGGTAPPQ